MRLLEELPDAQGILLTFNPVLLLIDQIAPRSWQELLIGTAWLLLLTLYIMLGIAFTHFTARLLRGPFGSEELRVQRRMATLSGFPFYTFCLLCFLGTPNPRQGLRPLDLRFWNFCLKSSGCLRKDGEHWGTAPDPSQEDCSPPAPPAYILHMKFDRAAYNNAFWCDTVCRSSLK